MIKTLRECEIEFKEVKYICKCGRIQKAVILVCNNYGFDTKTCENCKKRNFIEFDNGLVKIKG